MKIFLIIIVTLYFYLRRPVKCLSDINKAFKIIDRYNSFHEATEDEDRQRKYSEIARLKPLTDDLLDTYFNGAPSYQDFYDEQKIRSFYTRLHESIDLNRYNFKKYFHPKYLVRDIFFLPAAFVGFLLRLDFGRLSSFFLSCLVWIATILISAYALELRSFIDALIIKITGII